MNLKVIYHDDGVIREVQQVDYMTTFIVNGSIRLSIVHEGCKVNIPFLSLISIEDTDRPRPILADGSDAKMIDLQYHHEGKVHISSVGLPLFLHQFSGDTIDLSNGKSFAVRIWKIISITKP